MRTLPLALALAACSGCATTLSTLQTADVTDVGQVQATGGLGFYAPVGPVISAIDQGYQQIEALDAARQSGEPYAVSPEAQQQLLTLAVALAAMPPGQTWELSLRTGVWRDRMDVGLRYSVNAIRLDTKYQFLHRESAPQQNPLSRRAFDMAIGFGVSRYLFDNPALDLLEWVQLGEFSRWDFEVPLLASVDFGDVLKLYGGARYVYSTTTLDPKLVNYSDQASNISGLDLSVPAWVAAHYVGGIVGLGLGYRWIHLMLELNGGYTYSKPLLFGQRRQLGGPTFYPAVGLGVKFP